MAHGLTLQDWRGRWYQSRGASNLHAHAAGRCQEASVRTERDLRDRVLVMKRPARHPTGDCVPNTRSLIFTSRNHTPAIRTEGSSTYGGVVLDAESSWIA